MLQGIVKSFRYINEVNQVEQDVNKTLASFKYKDENWGWDDEVMDEAVGNPIHVYTLIRRLTRSLPRLLEFIEQDMDAKGT